MFANLIDETPPYTDPWIVPLDRRLAALRRPGPHIVWIYDHVDNSTFRYRVFNMAEALEADGRATGTWFFIDEVRFLLPSLKTVDTLILGRVRYSFGAVSIAGAARAQGIRVLFDCDDLVFDARYLHLIVETLGQEKDAAATWDFWFAYIGRLEAVARLCDGGITTNPYLGARMAGLMGGRPVSIVPNFFNKRQQDISDRLLAAKRARNFAGHGRIVFGYFSGTPSHRLDFALITPALARLLDDDPGARVRVVGFMDEIGELRRHAGRVEMLPFRDWVSLQRVIAEVEVNLAPLQDNAFTNCKSELKFFEAAAVGTWTIATPTYSLGQAIDDGRTGRLARLHEWDDALREAASLVRDPARFAPMALTAAAEVGRTYGWNRFGDRILHAAGVGKPDPAIVAHRGEGAGTALASEPDRARLPFPPAGVA